MNAATDDVFLSYSRADAEAVRQVQSRLKEAGLTTFLDRYALPAGQVWQPQIETALAGCRALVILLGPSGLGTWQHREIQLGLDRQATAEAKKAAPFPVIPVLLPGLQEDDIPLGRFLGLNTWIDLRESLDEPEALQRLVAGAQGQAIDGVAADHLLASVCPYRGLLPFREQDAGLFFGRTRFVDELVAKVRQRTAVNTVAVVGRSGSGKSSVVYAGLFPALRREKGLGEQAVWGILSLRPLAEPLHQLARAFAPPPHDADPITARAALNAHADRFRKREVTAAELVSDRLQTDKGTTRLLLYVDQWEELYTQAQPSEVRTEEDKRRAEDARLFIDLLLDAAATAPCTLVLSVRSDFYPDIQSHDRLRAAVQERQVSLGPMSEPELRAVIEGPAKAVGIRVHPDLTTRLVRDIGLDVTAGRNGQYDIGKLPLLEYALKETWRRREGQRLTLNAYGQAGGIDGAVAQHANQIFASLPQAQQAAARRLFVSLVTPGEGREDTRARAIYPEQDDAIAAVIDKFSAADARLLVTGEDVPTARRLVDLSHEAIIREWDLLKTWIETNREALRRREHIRGRLRQWEEQDRDPTLLLPPGLPLEEGRKLLADHGDVLIDEVQPYIAASLTADEERQRQAEAAAEAERQRKLADAQRLASEQRKRARVAIGFSLVTLLLAVGALWLWREAEARLGQAVDITRGFVRHAVQLSDKFGVPRPAIEVLLTEADAGFKGLIQRSTTFPTGLPLLRASPQLRSAYAELQMLFADHYRILERAELEWDAAQQARDKLKKLVTDDRSNPEWRRQLAISHDQIGDIHARRKQWEQALLEYEASRSISEELLDNWALSFTNYKIGNLLFAQRNHEKALKSFDRAIENLQSLPDDPMNIERQQHHLLVLNHRIGDVWLAKCDLKRAYEFYETSLSIAKKLAAHNPDDIQPKLDDIQPKLDLSASHDKMGDVLEEQGHLEAALKEYQESLLLTKQLHADDPKKADIKRYLSLGHENVGRILLEQKNPQAALDHYQESLAIRKELADEDQSSTKLQDVLLSHDGMGNVFKELGQVPMAIKEYQASGAIAERLAADDRTNTAWKFFSYRQLGQVRELEGDAEEALEMYCRAKDVAQSAHPSGEPTLPLKDCVREDEWQKQLDWLEERLAAVHGSGGPKC